jgi:hypothetical protein
MERALAYLAMYLEDLDTVIPLQNSDYKFRTDFKIEQFERVNDGLSNFFV